MADLRNDFVGIKSPNPFWLASAPPTDKAYNVERAFKAGWGAREIPLVYTRIGGQAARLGRGRASAALGHVIRRSPTAVCRALGEVLYRYAA